MADNRNRTPFYGAVPTSKLNANHVFMSDGTSLEEAITNNLLYPDLSKPLQTINTTSAEYTATTPSWVIGYCVGAGGASAIVYINNVTVAVGDSSGTGVANIIFPLKDGDVLTTRNVGSYNIVIYDTIK